MTANSRPASSPRSSFLALAADLNSVFPERSDVIEGLISAMLVGEHVFLLGLPGTAKSATVRALSGALGLHYFEWLLTRYSTPEEIFGPVSLRGLEQDRFARVTKAKLPEAEIAFLDEIFKANSGILNSLLTLANERIFHNDGAPQACPLRTLVGASNELPEGKELEALLDRFLLRFDVHYLRSDANARAMFTASEPRASVSIDAATFNAAQAEVAAVKVTDATIDALLAIRAACRAAGIIPSDRRWKKSIKLAQAAAWLAGSSETCPEDLGILVDALWREPKERAKVAAIVGEHADPVSAKVADVLDAAREAAAKIDGLRAAKAGRREFVAACAVALDDLRSQADRVREIAKGAGPRATKNAAGALDELDAMRAEFARGAGAGLGFAR